MSLQYYMQWQREVINSMIEDSILEAEAKGVRVLSLGLLNQASNTATTLYSCIKDKDSSLIMFLFM